VIIIKSIQAGRVITEGDSQSRDVTERQWTTAFYKTPISGAVQVTREGLAGDQVADTQNHGGPEKAVLCYSSAHYPRWAQEFSQLEMSGGAMGENLTLAGADEASVCIGDRFAIAQCIVEISQPRQPCWKIARRWGVKTLTKRVTQTGRTGWYLRVLQTGLIETGEEMKLVDRPHPNWTVARANDVMFGREVDRMAVIELMNLGKLSHQWKDGLA